MVNKIIHVMKYLYYSLHLMYTKVAFIQNHYRPLINIAAVLGVLQSFLIFAVINTFFYLKTGQEIVPYHFMIPVCVALVLYWFNMKYFDKKEKLLIKEMTRKPLWEKWAIVLVSFSVISFIIYFWMFDGLYKIVSLLLK